MAYIPLYKQVSPYSQTPIVGRFLGYYVHRPIPADRRDRAFKIRSERYVAQPNNLAWDFYGNDDLWWVFGVRNGFEDPVFSFLLGVWIIVPDPNYIQRLIGI